ncbi:MULTISPECIES: glutathione S-transferase [unclassified Meridianimarinicoccus]|uniref:glutathione S-transferase n=1 Tax=unclassified Meridianimarinicoccus TaxID=2923344 RepID=UPI0018677E8B|nr:glutathione S-transferase [Fluviibacterium sp. MJW13]
MTHILALADPAHSSWSMRIGLLIQRFDLPVSLTFADLYTPDFPKMLADFAPARTVPALKLDDGTVVCESLAIAEELASRFPDAGLWPQAPSARAHARGLTAEMHAGFMVLRDKCPMNLRTAYENTPLQAEVQADLDRLEDIWGRARDRFAADGPWLCGPYSIADAFFAPVAGRIAGYGLKVGPVSAAYTAAHLADPAFQAWRAMGLAQGPHQATYDRPFPQRPWPTPADLNQT